MTGVTSAEVRIEGGAVFEELAMPDAEPVAVCYTRCPAGWSAKFTLRDPEVAELSVVHRLVAPTLREARRAVPAAVSFLRGEPVAKRG